MLRSWISIFLFGFIFSFETKAAPPRSDLPTVYFDLGNVLIDTTNETQFKYVEGAEIYLQSLSRREFRLALITNVPDTWGRTQAEKFRSLKSYVAKYWIEPRPFPWEAFDRILIPPADKYRKPHPYLFQQALQYPDRCQPLFQGEDPAEVETAARLKIATYLVPEKATPRHPKFAPISKILCKARQDRFQHGDLNGN